MIVISVNLQLIGTSQSRLCDGGLTLQRHRTAVRTLTRSERCEHDFGLDVVVKSGASVPNKIIIKR